MEGVSSSLEPFPLLAHSPLVTRTGRKGEAALLLLLLRCAPVCVDGAAAAVELLLAAAVAQSASFISASAGSVAAAELPAPSPTCCPRLGAGRAPSSVLSCLAVRFSCVAEIQKDRGNGGAGSICDKTSPPCIAQTSTSAKPWLGLALSHLVSLLPVQACPVVPCKRRVVPPAWPAALACKNHTRPAPGGRPPAKWRNGRKRSVRPGWGSRVENKVGNGGQTSSGATPAYVVQIQGDQGCGLLGCAALFYALSCSRWHQGHQSLPVAGSIIRTLSYVIITGRAGAWQCTRLTPAPCAESWPSAAHPPCRRSAPSVQ